MTGSQRGFATAHMRTTATGLSDWPAVLPHSSNENGHALCVVIVVFDIRQAADAVALKAAVQR